MKNPRWPNVTALRSWAARDQDCGEIEGRLTRPSGEPRARTAVIEMSPNRSSIALRSGLGALALMHRNALTENAKQRP